MRSTFKQVTTIVVIATALATVASVASAQTRQSGSARVSKALTWGPAPAVFPAGARMAVESGDPSKSGEFVVRFSFPSGYRIPPHFHPTAEHVRIRSGTFLVGMGDTIDESKTMKMTPGDTGTIPPKMHHYAIARGATVLSIRAQGPFAMTYVNAADDPQKQGKR